jgi:hypothetical protein
MSMLGVGADFKEFQKLFAPRVAELASEFIEPLDEVNDAVTRAEHELDALRSRLISDMTDKWNRYKSAYERCLRPEALPAEDESVDSDDREQTELSQTSDKSDVTETSTERSTDESARSQGEVTSGEFGPDELPEAIDESAPERDEGASS